MEHLKEVGFPAQVWQGYLYAVLDLAPFLQTMGARL